MATEHQLSLEQARRLAMLGQGLLDSPRASPTCEEIVRRLAYVQLDSIQTVDRAHHRILAVRSDRYRAQHLITLTEKKRRLFEHWTHDASVIPVQYYGHWRHRFERFDAKMKTRKWWQERMGPDPERTLQTVLRRIEEEGALPTRAFRSADGRRGPWWGWSQQKSALEHLWRCGRLAVSARLGFEKVYDLPERVFPAEVLQARPSWKQSVDWACHEASRRLLVASPKQLAHFFELVSTREARQWADKHLDPVRVEGAQLYAVRDWKELLNNAPEPPSRLRFLSPFDPLIRDRKRLTFLFGFDYRLEAFTPSHKRRYGYYVLPILEGDRLVGRIEPKRHRKQKLLEVRGLWLEPGVQLGKGRRRRLEQTLERYARRLDCEEIQFDSSVLLSKRR